MKFFLIVLAIFTSNITFADDASHDHLEPEPAEKKIVKITKNGLLPTVLKLSKSDSSVFFLNDLEGKDINLKIVVKGKTLHCASSNLKIQDDFLVSVNPIKPTDFAGTCFPDSGSYDYEVSGAGLKPLKGVVKVEF